MTNSPRLRHDALHFVPPENKDPYGGECKAYFVACIQCDIALDGSPLQFSRCAQFGQLDNSRHRKNFCARSVGLYHDSVLCLYSPKFSTLLHHIFSTNYTFLLLWEVNRLEISQMLGQVRVAGPTCIIQLAVERYPRQVIRLKEVDNGDRGLHSLVDGFGGRKLTNSVVLDGRASKVAVHSQFRELVLAHAGEYCRRHGTDDVCIWKDSDVRRGCTKL